MRPSIVFDFDGTLALGHGPVRAYAVCLADTFGSNRGGVFLANVEAALQAYDEGASEYRDGYHVVGALGESEGASAAQLGEAYLRSRSLLGTQDGPVEGVEGLAELLAELGRRARLVLATNAPAAGVTELLDTWGVRERFDELHFDIGKPAGLEQLVCRLIADGPVLSIGDIAEFDLVPAAAFGADTALVGARSASHPGSVTMRGRSLAEIRGDIETWVDAAASHDQHTSHDRASSPDEAHPTEHRTER